MLDTLLAIFLSLPLLTVGWLFAASSDLRRHAGLWFLALTVSNVLLMYFLVSWAQHTTGVRLFADSTGIIVRSFFEGTWVPVIYTLTVLLAGYLADRFASRRIASSSQEH